MSQSTGSERLGIAGTGTIACGLARAARDRLDVAMWARSEESAERARERFCGLCEALGKTAIEVPDVPGFVVNRLLFPFLFEAVRLLDIDGVEPESIDRCMQLGARHPMGPLKLLDFVGLDVATSIGEQIGVEIPQRVRDLIDEGRLGQKSGAGFYEY